MLRKKSTTGTIMGLDIKPTKNNARKLATDLSQMQASVFRQARVEHFLDHESGAGHPKFELMKFGVALEQAVTNDLKKAMNAVLIEPVCKSLEALQQIEASDRKKIVLEILDQNRRKLPKIELIEFYIDVIDALYINKCDALAMHVRQGIIDAMKIEDGIDYANEDAHALAARCYLQRELQNTKRWVETWDNFVFPSYAQAKAVYLQYIDKKTVKFVPSAQHLMTLTFSRLDKADIDCGEQRGAIKAIEAQEDHEEKQETQDLPKLSELRKQKTDLAVTLLEDLTSRKDDICRDLFLITKVITDCLPAQDALNFLELWKIFGESVKVNLEPPKKSMHVILDELLKIKGVKERLQFALGGKSAMPNPMPRLFSLSSTGRLRAPASQRKGFTSDDDTSETFQSHKSGAPGTELSEDVTSPRTEGLLSPRTEDSALSPRTEAEESEGEFSPRVLGSTPKGESALSPRASMLFRAVTASGSPRKDGSPLNGSPRKDGSPRDGSPRKDGSPRAKVDRPLSMSSK